MLHPGRRFFPASATHRRRTSHPTSSKARATTSPPTRPGGYFQDLLDRLLGATSRSETVDLTEPGDVWERPGPAFGDPRLAPQRLGQQAFQAVVLDAYHRSCAITGTKIRPVLQAAHVRPLTSRRQHRLDNGLLLRSDVHTLFDRGYLAVDTRYRLQVSPRLRDGIRQRRAVLRPGWSANRPTRNVAVERPHRDVLEWHLDTVFKAS